ncbi:hypothetical protein LTR78_004177 [Recurvomyces mirabilis]|uniref:Uncharacterized protein n=1 Tax=Recurvomyces mirabilis TaxID=574656 RepID=A0AAE1C2R8_9PEZI|nr:hypothetical protein LTR78_004177 [Recurvomyces mirabilis]KAK5153652.1 hypothetical protein LTS14_007346 [Recurvomyces mirabilis]
MARYTAPRVLALVLLLLAIWTTTTYASSLPDNAADGSYSTPPSLGERQNRLPLNPQALYGIGVRTGSYLQGFAFVIGFTYLDDVDPKSQFSGIILALQLLIRWWNKHNTHTASLSELWIGLAQLLIITTPGAFLLFFSFGYQRRQWKTADNRPLHRWEVIRDQGLNFLLVFAVLTGVGATNITMALTATDAVHYTGTPAVVDGVTNPLWIFKVWPAQGSYMLAFMWIQSGVTIILEAIPYTIYLSAWAVYGRDYFVMTILRRNMHRESHEVEEKRTETNWMDRLIDWMYSWPKELGLVMLYSLACAYVVILIFSVERTITAADIGPTGTLADPSQLLPFITGVIAIVNALASAANRFSMVSHHVSHHRLLNGGTLIFYKDGRYYQNGQRTEVNNPGPGGYIPLIEYGTPRLQRDYDYS